MSDIILIGLLVLGFLLGKNIGVIKMVYNFCAMIISFILLRIITPIIMPIVVKTPVYDLVYDKVVSTFKINDSLNNLTRAAEASFIEQIPIADSFKGQLIENNNVDIYEALGVSTFADYVNNMITYVLVFIGTSIVVYICICLIMFILSSSFDIFSKLPIISTVNSLIGGLFGLCTTVLIIWFAAYIINLFVFGGFANSFNEFVNNGYISKMFFTHNIFDNLFLNIFN